MLTKKAQIGIVGTFAVFSFAIASFAAFSNQREISANAPATEVSSKVTPQASPQGGDVTLTVTDNSIPSPVSTTPSLTYSPLAVLGPTQSSSPPNAIASTEEQKLFYQDFRYILLIVDGALITLLILVLLIRLTAKFFSQPTMQQPIALPKKDEPVTIDKLDVDIPI